MRLPVEAAPEAAMVVVTVAAPAVEARKPVTVPARAVGAPMKPRMEPMPAAMAGAARPPVTANSAPPPTAAAPTCMHEVTARAGGFRRVGRSGNRAKEVERRTTVARYWCARITPIFAADVALA